MGRSKWRKQEIDIFYNTISFQRKWREISEAIQTKSAKQVRGYYYRVITKLADQLELLGLEISRRDRSATWKLISEYAKMRAGEEECDHNEQFFHQLKEKLELTEDNENDDEDESEELTFDNHVDIQIQMWPARQEINQVMQSMGMSEVLFFKLQENVRLSWIFQALDWYKSSFVFAFGNGEWAVEVEGVNYLFTEIDQHYLLDQITQNQQIRMTYNFIPTPVTHPTPPTFYPDVPVRVPGQYPSLPSHSAPKAEPRSFDLNNSFAMGNTICNSEISTIPTEVPAHPQGSPMSTEFAVASPYEPVYEDFSTPNFDTFQEQTLFDSYLPVDHLGSYLMPMDCN